MNTYERAILSDFLANYVFPAFEPPVLATAGQTTFTLSKAWNITYDLPVAYVNGQRRSATFATTTTVTITPAAALNDHVGILVVPGGAAGYLPRNGGALLSDLDAAGYRINNLGPATLGHQPVRRDQVEALATAAGDASYLRRDGTNSPSADIAFAGRTITGIRNAAAAQEPVAKSQMDALDAAIDGRLDPLEAAVAALQGEIASTAVQITAAGSGTWTVPSGIHRLMAVLVSGGSSGAVVHLTPIEESYGGAGGNIRTMFIDVAPGDVLSYSIGIGGAGGTAGSSPNIPSNPGTATTLTFGSVTITAPGGSEITIDTFGSGGGFVAAPGGDQDANGLPVNGLPGAWRSSFSRPAGGIGGDGTGSPAVGYPGAGVLGAGGGAWHRGWGGKTGAGGNGFICFIW